MSEARRKRSRAWSVAVHEAGHAVMALHEGLGIKRLVVDETLDDRRIRGGARYLTDARHPMHADDDALMRISLAGVMADRLAAARWLDRMLDGAHNDLCLVADFLREFSPTKARREFLISWNVEATHNHLVATWTLVDAIAAALVNYRDLDEAKVRQIIDATTAQASKPDESKPPGRLGRDGWQRLVARIRFHVDQPGGLLAAAPAHVRAYYAAPRLPE